MRRLDEILLFGGADRQPVLDLGKPRSRGVESLGGARDASILPHHLSYGVRADLRRSAVDEHRHLPGASCRLRPERLDRCQISRNPLGKDESLEQGIRREPVGAVHTGSCHLADTVQSSERGTA